MKRQRKTLSSLLFLLLTSCGLNEKQSGNCCGVVFDHSDTFQETKNFSVSALQGFFQLKNNPNASAYCILSSISDRRHAAILYSSLEGASVLQANSLERDRLHDSFYRSVDKNIRTLKQTKVGTKSSFVCYAIAEMLNKIATCSCRKKRVVVLGDLAENNSIFSIYTPDDILKLRTNPQEVFSIFDKEYPLPNLQGIEVIFIHQPNSTEKDEEYHFLSSFFKKYYQGHGARVSISSSFNNLPNDKQEQ